LQAVEGGVMVVGIEEVMVVVRFYLSDPHHNPSCFGLDRINKLFVYCVMLQVGEGEGEGMVVEVEEDLMIGMVVTETGMVVMVVVVVVVVVVVEIGIMIEVVVVIEIGEDMDGMIIVVKIGETAGIGLIKLV